MSATTHARRAPSELPSAITQPRTNAAQISGPNAHRMSVCTATLWPSDEVEPGEREPERQHVPEMVSVNPNRLGDELADRPLLGRQRGGARLACTRIRRPGHRA